MKLKSINNDIFNSKYYLQAKFTKNVHSKMDGPGCFYFILLPHGKSLGPSGDFESR